ncbi:MAG: enoyl-[acyl-carrier-protein] reductase FabK [Firmicutes bacterium]|jgi:enoyl-[acyl-carrier protein] reductase II|nr:enoyl-[acyl-carrier-protein] reductase FabK [Bacillota bacterium]HOB34860.1 enoyl-[acyl-carrier-protein] reductase FabK [Bacillota bacterium]HPZ90396.1 enoyl-[acyl-carrier-protein] reductase FabK [Bacillota bacterium]HQE02494.1 enoyl-[acyl-carrier-protein] reductase FabK [Bacillota bacterium]
MIETKLTELLDIRYPLFQGGMAWLATHELAAAVSEAGGLGVIGAGNAPPEWVQAQIDALRRKTARPFGVNVMLLSPYAAEVMEVVIENKVPVVTTGAGNPGPWLERLKNAGCRVFPVVASVAMARRLARMGVDGLVAEGGEAGGHVGELSTMVLVPQVVDAVDLPVVAAGGIADGRGVAAALALGAAGVQVGTRFVCAAECVAHPRYKEAILKAGDRDAVVSGRSTGHPVRCLKNRFWKEFTSLEKAGAPPEELERLGTGKYHAAAILGDVENGSVLAGQAAAMVNKIQPAADIVTELFAGAGQVCARLGGLAP